MRSGAVRGVAALAGADAEQSWRGTDVMSTDDAVELNEPLYVVADPAWADLCVWWETSPDLVRRPESAPGRVVAGLFPWGQRTRQRVIDLYVEPFSASAARHILMFMCEFWEMDEVGECAAACTGELVANAIAHAQWPPEGRQRVSLIVSVSAGTLVVEVSDPDPRLPVPKAAVDWDAVDWSAPGGVGESGFGLGIVQSRVAEFGGEFGCVSGARGKSVFFALPVPEHAALLMSEDAETGAR